MAMMGKTEVRLGCQAFSKDEWQGDFYPGGLKQDDRLAYYATAFDFVELDNTFYRVPSADTVEKWRDSTPERFLFAAKLPQAITHDPDPKTRLPRRPLEAEGWEGRLEWFADRIRLLKDKLAAVVVQLPPQWHFQPDRVATLETFLSVLPRDIRWAVEFRHRGWLCDQVLELLRAHDVTLVSQDLYYMPRLVEVTSPTLAYVRLLSRRKQSVRMSEAEMERDEALGFWADAVRDLAAQGVRKVIVTANNNYQGFSPGTIAALRARLGFAATELPTKAA